MNSSTTEINHDMVKRRRAKSPLHWGDLFKVALWHSGWNPRLTTRKTMFKSCLGHLSAVRPWASQLIYPPQFLTCKMGMMIIVVVGANVIIFVRHCANFKATCLNVKYYYY